MRHYWYAILCLDTYDLRIIHTHTYSYILIHTHTYLYIAPTGNNWVHILNNFENHTYAYILRWIGGDLWGYILMGTITHVQSLVTLYVF